MIDKAAIEQQLAELPLFQYDWITTSELVFSERVRYICQTQCPMYNTTWACPPAVGTVEECKARCLSYPEALMMTSITEVSDIANLEETLATRGPHEELTRQVRDMIAAQGVETRALSTEACAICQHCAYPDAPCRHPDRVRPSLEAFGFDIGAISSELLHNELKWSRDGQLPEYFTLVSALFCAESGDTGTFTLTAQNPIP